MAVPFFEVPYQASAVSGHELVFERDDGLRATGVSLSGAPAEQLPVDTSRFVSFGRDNVQTAEFGDASTQFYIGTPARHVGCHGNLASMAGRGHNLGLFPVPDSVQDVVFETPCLKLFAEPFACLYASRTDESSLGRKSAMRYHAS